MFYVNAPGKNHIKGFSLIEIMVGMTVGLLSMLVITQMTTIFENQKRTTTAGSDAQENGLMALVSLEQAIRPAGSGFTNSAAFTCAPAYTYSYVSTSASPPLSPFFPVQIIDGGVTGSDSITIQTASNFLGNIPATITTAMPSSSSELNVSRTTGFTTNDLILVSDGSGRCTLMQITAVQPAALKLQHNPGGTPSYNPSPVPASWPAYLASSTILDMGQMTTSTFSINTANNLQVQDSQLAASAVAATTKELVTDIVSLQAQYGVALPAGAKPPSQAVTNWVDATGPWATPSATDIKTIKAIRLVIVARSGKKETKDVTQTCINTTGTVNNGPCAWTESSATDPNPAPKIDLSFLPNGTANPDWQKYRYKVYQTIIPLRNVIWADI
jgi:type IV pilus assembly protein PilW